MGQSKCKQQEAHSRWVQQNIRKELKEQPSNREMGNPVYSWRKRMNRLFCQK